MVQRCTWGYSVKMKYEHNEVHDKTVGEIVRGGFGKCKFVNSFTCKSICPLQKICQKECWVPRQNQKRQRVIEYIAEEVAEFWENEKYEVSSIEEWKQFYCFPMGCDEIKFKDKYPVDEQTAKEIADVARVLLEGDEVQEKDPFIKKFEQWKENNYIADILDGNRPTTADAFYVYNSDLEKCITVSREQGDDIIDIAIHNEMDIATARVFCEKLASFLRMVDDGK